MRLSPHFDTSEFLSPDRSSIPRSYVDELRELCTHYLEPLREAYGPVTVHSGHRSPRHNRRVGGAPESRHLDLAGAAGAAADVSAKRGRPLDWYRLLERLHPGGLGLYETHVHVDNRRGRARW